MGMSAQSRTALAIECAGIKRVSAQAACLPSMLAAIEFVHPTRKIELMIECQNFAEDIAAAMSQLLKVHPHD